VRRGGPTERSRRARGRARGPARRPGASAHVRRGALHSVDVPPEGIDPAEVGWLVPDTERTMRWELETAGSVMREGGVVLLDDAERNPAFAEWAASGRAPCWSLVRRSSAATTSAWRWPARASCGRPLRRGPASPAPRARRRPLP
jgi:hypothetical protein